MGRKFRLRKYLIFVAVIAYLTVFLFMALELDKAPLDMHLATKSVSYTESIFIQPSRSHANDTNAREPLLATGTRHAEKKEHIKNAVREANKKGINRGRNRKAPKKDYSNISFIGDFHYTAPGTELPLAHWTDEELKTFETATLRSDRRKRNLRDYCKPEKTTWYPSRWITQVKYKLLYCQIEKTGTTTWKRFMLALGGLPVDKVKKLSKGTVHGQQLFRLGYIKDEKTKEIQAKYYTFMFVRHPFDRLVSAYRNKFLDPYKLVEIDQYGPAIIHLFRNSSLTYSEARQAANNISFEEFLRFVVWLHVVPTSRKYAFGKFVATDIHWRLMTQLCPPCPVRIDFLAKYETFHQDADAILHNAGVNYRFFHNIKDKYKIPSSDLAEQYFKKIPNSLILDAYNVFKDDFDAFSYTPNAYLNTTV